MSEATKKAIAYHAVESFIKSGTIVGLGTGSTAYFVVERLGQLLREKKLENIVCIPTSEATRKQAEELKIPLTTLDQHSVVDVAIDGADEVDAKLNLVKGRGGALLREKMVAEAAKTFIIVVDKSKVKNSGIGCDGAMPVEVSKFCYENTTRKILQVEGLGNGVRAELRKSKENPDKPFETDNQNYIIDLFFAEPIKEPFNLGIQLKQIVGVVEHGLFIKMASLCLVGNPNGTIETIKSD